MSIPKHGMIGDVVRGIAGATLATSISFVTLAGPNATPALGLEDDLHLRARCPDLKSNLGTLVIEIGMAGEIAVNDQIVRVDGVTGEAFADGGPVPEDTSDGKVPEDVKLPEGIYEINNLKPGTFSVFFRDITMSDYILGIGIDCGQNLPTPTTTPNTAPTSSTSSPTTHPVSTTVTSPGTTVTTPGSSKKGEPTAAIPSRQTAGSNTNSVTQNPGQTTTTGESAINNHDNTDVSLPLGGASAALGKTAGLSVLNGNTQETSNDAGVDPNTLWGTPNEAGASLLDDDLLVAKPESSALGEPLLAGGIILMLGVAGVSMVARGKRRLFPRRQS